MAKSEPEQVGPGLHVIALEANNFMRLRAVRVVPRGHVVEVVGRNGAGKTSTLDAIFCTIAGAASLPAVPVRAGERSGETFVDLGELRVTRKYDASGPTSLKVEQRDGTRVKSPQAVLDRLISLVAFDPLEFASAPPAAQAETLRRLVGLDLSDLDRKQAELAEERADLNKSLKAQEYEYQAYGPDAEWEQVPDAPVSLAEILGRLKAVQAERLEIVKKRTAYRDLMAELGQRIAASEKAEADVIRLRKRLADAEAAASDAAESVRSVSEMIEKRMPEIEALVDPDTAPVEREIAESEALNRDVRRKQERKALRETMDGNRESAAEILRKLFEIKAEKASRLAAVTFPVEGLGFTEDGLGVTLRGVPVAQASTAEAVVAGLGVAAALSPRLRVARIKDGSLLDDDTMRAVAEWAAANSFQVWCERVGGPNSPSGIIIEDGSVLADRQPGEPPPASPRYGASALAMLDDEPKNGAEDVYG